MTLIDTYAYVGDSATDYAEMRDYIVSFVDRDNQLVYTAIRTEGYSEFSEKCEAYLYLFRALSELLYLSETAKKLICILKRNIKREVFSNA